MSEFPDIPFALVSDLEKRWKPLSADEKVTAETLLEDASQIIMNRCGNAKHKDAATLRMVVCDVVKRAMAGPLSFGVGIESFQQTGGPYQGSVQFANPMGDLYLSKSDLRTLGCGGQTAFTIKRG